METAVKINAFLDSWRADDKKRTRRLRRYLGTPDASADALALAACYDLSNHQYLEAARGLQRALDRRRDEWADWGRCLPRPSVSKRLDEASARVQQEKEKDAEYPGLHWLEALLAACRLKEEESQAILDQMTAHDLPKWLQCNLRSLHKTLEQASAFSSRRNVREEHPCLSKDFPCPLLKGDGRIPRCRAARSIDAPENPEDLSLCRDGSWYECPYFVRLRLARGKKGEPGGTVLQAVQTTNRLMEAEDFEGALPHAKAGIEADPMNDTLHGDCGTAQRHLKRFEESYRHYAVARELNPTDPMHPAAMAAVALEMGRPELAESLADQALALDPGHTTALNNKAESFKARGMRADVVLCYQRALEHAPQNIDYLRGMINSLAWLGRFEAALDAAKGIRSIPGHTPQDEQLEEILYAQIDNLNAEREQAKEFVARWGKPEAALPRLRSRASAARYLRDLLILGRRNECKAAMGLVAKSDAKTSLQHMLKATALYLNRKGTADLEKAADHFEEGLRKHRNSYEIYRCFGLYAVNTYFYMAQYEEALDCALKFACADPHNESLAAMIPNVMNLMGRSSEDVDKVKRSFSWRSTRRHILPAVALCALPMILIILLPMETWLHGLLSLVWGGSSVFLLRSLFGRMIPVLAGETFGMWVAWFSAIPVAVVVLIHVEGTFSKIVGVVWYGFLSMLAGANIKEDKEEQSDDAQSA